MFGTVHKAQDQENNHHITCIYYWPQAIDRMMAASVVLNQLKKRGDSTLCARTLAVPDESVSPKEVSSI